MSDVQTLLKEADKLISEKALAEALAVLDKAVLAATTDPVPRGRRAECLMLLGRHAKAVHDADDAVRLAGGEADPAALPYLMMAAQAQRTLEKFKEAKLYLGHIRALPGQENNDAAVALLEEIDAAEEAKIVPNSPEHGERYLAKMDASGSYYRLPSGLRFRALRLSRTSGALSPTLRDPCTVHYHGTLLDGKIFDSSVNRGKPSSFAPNQVIKGWTEALQLMREGDKWEVILPPELAYGKKGAGKDIAPNSTLIFTIELIKVQKGGKPGEKASAALKELIGKTHAEL